MKQFLVLRLMLVLVLVVGWGFVRGQVLFVDVVHGDDGGTGTADAPVASLGRAVELADALAGASAGGSAGARTGALTGASAGSVTIKVAPGLYTLTSPVDVRGQGEAGYVIEATVLPDDSGWVPACMPVIQCLADSNRKGKLAHASVGIFVERSHVSIRGLKFVGNPNPASAYYYAIERRDSTLVGLEISQCYFVGDKRSAPMQGAVMAQGAGISVDHCLFYGVKNAVMVFLGLRDFSLTHSVVVGAYEGAFWYGYGPSADVPFVFSDNIIADGNYFFVGYAGRHSGYVFRHSLIAGNLHYIGFNGMEVSPDHLNRPLLVGMRKRGKVVLTGLRLAASSAGADIDAGIFRGKPGF